MLPYAFDTNDMQYYNASRFAGADFANYVIDAFEWLKREGETAPKMMSVGLHLRMIGRPGRIGALERIISHMTYSGVADRAAGSDCAALAGGGSGGCVIHAGELTKHLRHTRGVMPPACV